MVLEGWPLSWWQTVFLIVAAGYIAGIIYQIAFEDKKAHRVDVMRHRMRKMERDSLIRKISN